MHEPDAGRSMNAAHIHESVQYYISFHIMIRVISALTRALALYRCSYVRRTYFTSVGLIQFCSLILFFLIIQVRATIATIHIIIGTVRLSRYNSESKNGLGNYITDYAKNKMKSTKVLTLSVCTHKLLLLLHRATS